MARKRSAYVNLDHGSFPKLMYSLESIMELFHVSKTTAWRYKNGLLKEACTQRGKIIVVDVCKALELFGVSDAGRFVR